MQVSNKTILEAVKDYYKAREIFTAVVAQERLECDHSMVGEAEGESYHTYDLYDLCSRYPNKRICMKCGLVEEIKYGPKVLKNDLVYKLNMSQLTAIERSTR